LAMEQALNRVRGRDPTSIEIRKSLDLLIEVHHGRIHETGKRS
jgi:hypothetical protein